MPAAKFGELFSSAWSQFREKFNVLLPAIVLFAVLNTLFFVLVPAGNQQAMMTGHMNPSLIGMSIVGGILGALVGIISYLYYLLSFIKKESNLQSLISQTLPLIGPFIGLSIMVMIKSWVWLTFVGGVIMATAVVNPILAPIGGLLMLAGIIAGIVFGPRYMPAIVLWLVEGKSINETIKRSYDVTAGYWGKIVGNLILVGLIFGLLMIGVSIVAGILSGVVGAIAGSFIGMIIMQLVTGFFAQCYQAYLSVFMLKLTATMVTNPNAASEIKKA